MIHGFTGNLAARLGRWIWAEQVFGIACRYYRQKLDRQRPVEPDPEVERAGSIGWALTAISLDIQRSETSLLTSGAPEASTSPGSSRQQFYSCGTVSALAVAAKPAASPNKQCPASGGEQVGRMSAASAARGSWVARGP
jgi:hypothetical protein